MPKVSPRIPIKNPIQQQNTHQPDTPTDSAQKAFFTSNTTLKNQTDVSTDFEDHLKNFSRMNFYPSPRFHTEPDSLALKSLSPSNRSPRVKRAFTKQLTQIKQENKPILTP